MRDSIKCKRNSRVSRRWFNQTSGTQVMGEWFDMLEEVKEIKTVDELIMR